MRTCFAVLLVSLIIGCSVDEKIEYELVTCGEFEEPDCFADSIWTFNSAAIVSDPENNLNHCVEINKEVSLKIEGVIPGNRYIFSYDRKITHVWDSPDNPIVGWIVSLQDVDGIHSSGYTYAEFSTNNPDTLWHHVSELVVANDFQISVHFGVHLFNTSAFVDNVSLIEL